MGDRDDTARLGGVVAPIGDDRVVERGRGCWNCTMFRQGPDVEKEWLPELERAKMDAKMSGRMYVPEFGSEQHAALRVSDLMNARGVSQADAVALLEEEKFRKAKKIMEDGAGPGTDPWELDKRVRDKRAVLVAIQMGLIGMCGGGGEDRHGNPVGKFIQCEHLCRKWNGRQGHSLATANRPLDKLSDELHEIADDKASGKGK